MSSMCQYYHGIISFDLNATTTCGTLAHAIVKPYHSNKHIIVLNEMPIVLRNTYNSVIKTM